MKEFNYLPSIMREWDGIGCPDLLPPLHPEGPLCLPHGATFIHHRDIIAVTWWLTRSVLTEGPAPGTWFAHFPIREGHWQIVEFGAMNHSSETREITIMYHDTNQWHAIGNRVLPRQFEWVFALHKPIVWQGCSLGVIFRDLWHGSDDILFINFTLRGVKE